MKKTPKEFAEELKLLNTVRKSWSKCFDHFNKGHKDKADEEYRSASKKDDDLRTLIYENDFRTRPDLRDLYRKLLIELDRVDFLSEYNIAYKAQESILAALDKIKGYYDQIEVII